MYLHQTSLVANKASGVGVDFDAKLDTVGGEPVLETFRRGLDRLADIDRPQFSSSFLVPASRVAGSRMLSARARSAFAGATRGGFCTPTH